MCVHVFNQINLARVSNTIIHLYKHKSHFTQFRRSSKHALKIVLIRSVPERKKKILSTTSKKIFSFSCQFACSPLIKQIVALFSSLRHAYIHKIQVTTQTKFKFPLITFFLDLYICVIEILCLCYSERK